MPRQTTYSEELQDIMGRIPGWVIRWGVTMIFLIFLTVVGLSFFVRYPKVIEAPIVLTTINPPADLMAKSTGKIEIFLVKDNDPVYKYSVIAILLNTANYRDVLLLEKQLKIYGENWDNYVGPVFTEQHNINAGEMQSYFSQFAKACKLYKHYLEVAYVPKKLALLREQINIQRANYENQKSQMALLGKEMELEKISLARDSVIYSLQAMTMSDYQRSQQNMMQKESALIGQRSSIAQTESSILANEGQLVELNIQYENDITNMILQLTESRAQLLSQINLWKDRYLVTSPINGRITFTIAIKAR